MTEKLTKPDENGNRKLVKRLSPPRKDKIFRRLEKSLSREELQLAVAASPNEKAELLLLHMTDPALRTMSLPTMAKRCGLRYADVLKLIRDYRLDQGLLKMTEHVPRVMEDIAVDAQSQVVKCPSCSGMGELWKYDKEENPIEGSNKVCVTCDGTGKLRKIGDADARKLMFETLKLTGQRGPLVAQQFNMGSAGSVEDVVDVVEGALAAPIEAIEAEVTDEPDRTAPGPEGNEPAAQTDR
jgi:hypothetical protein